MLDLNDIQGLVFSGHGNMPHSCFLFLQVQDLELAQAWLKLIIPEIVAATRRAPGAPKPDSTAHIAFSCAGLGALGLDDDALAQFPREFIEGMSLGERPRVLGDWGASAPEKWQFGGPLNPDIHILLALYGETYMHLEEFKSKPWYPTLELCGVCKIYNQESYRKNDNEPFGFRDGISQPTIEGSPGHRHDSIPGLAPGEMVLGYENAYTNITPAPSVRSALDAKAILPVDSVDPSRKSFGLNGTFLVLRKLAQDVDGFWKFCEQNSLMPNGMVDPLAKTAFAAKLVGRWPSGCPLTLSEKVDDSALGSDANRNNDFLFSETDLLGHKCPIGAHIRRSYPRDVLHPNKKDRSIAISNRHRITRRGRPYEDKLAGELNGKTEVGLIFIAINADLQRQFEFVQQTWLNNPTFNGLTNDQDPIASNVDGNGRMSIQGEPVRKTVHGIPTFVTVRGGAYFFLPGMKALNFLANIPEAAASRKQPAVPSDAAAIAPVADISGPPVKPVPPTPPMHTGATASSSETTVN